MPPCARLRVGATREARARWSRLQFRSVSIGSDPAIKPNEDGTTSLVLVTPSVTGIELLVTEQDGKSALVLNDGQHEYAWVKQ